MLHSRRLLKFLTRTQLPQCCRRAASFPVLPSQRYTGYKSRNAANSGLHGSSFAKFFSTASPDAVGKDRNSSTSADDGPESSKKEPEISKESAEESEAEKQAKSDYESGTESDEAEDQPKSSGVEGLLKEREALLKEKDRMIVEMKTNVLNTLAEIENIRGRTRRDAEGIKKYALENFATSLLDVADNLGKAAATVPESVHNEALANDTSSNAKLLKSLLEGVDMTQRQLMKIFSKFGVEKFDPIGQIFDPNQHLAIVEVEDASKEPQTIVSTVKPGYRLNDKLIRPAEVGVVKKAEKAE